MTKELGIERRYRERLASMGIKSSLKADLARIALKRGTPADSADIDRAIKEMDEGGEDIFGVNVPATVKRLAEIEAYRPPPKDKSLDNDHDK